MASRFLLSCDTPSSNSYPETALQVCQIPEHASATSVVDMFCVLLVIPRKTQKVLVLTMGRKGGSGERGPLDIFHVSSSSVLEGGWSMGVRTHTCRPVLPLFPRELGGPIAREVRARATLCFSSSVLGFLKV